MKKCLFVLPLLVAMLVGCTAEEPLPTDADRLYGHFAEREGLAVAQVDGFRVNEEVKVDVVMLVADSPEDWQQLMDEMKIKVQSDVSSWLGSIDHPEQRTVGGTFPAWRVTAMHDERTLAFYHVSNDVQLDALRNYQLDKMQQNP